MPPYNATVVDRLEAAGAIIIGKTNLDEFAMGSSTENSAFGPSRNPWATGPHAGRIERRIGGRGRRAACRPPRWARTPGGSIRQPAALTGVVGLKPTYGRVSRYGLLAFASSLDQIGPLTRTAADAALLLEVIAGADPHDATAPPRTGARAYRDALTGDVSGLRIGIPRAVLGEGVDDAVLRRSTTAIDVLRARGARMSTSTCRTRSTASRSTT